MNERQDDEVVLGDAPFDERRALEELERIRQEIVRYQAVREGVNDEFERFVQAFKKPDPPVPSIERSRTEELARAALSPRVQEAARIPEAVRKSQSARLAEPPLPVSPPEPVVPPLPPPPLPEPSVPREAIQPPTARFEPLNLEPFIKRADHPQTASVSADTPIPQRVPTSPEEFIPAREDDERSDAFAPGTDFDALPPPLEPVAETLAPPAPPPAAARPIPSRTWIVLGSIVAVVAVGGYAWKLTHSSDAAVVEQPANKPPAAPPRAAAQTPTPGPAASDKPHAAATSRSEIITTQPAWVRVIADGQRIVERELPANSRIPFDAQKTIQIRTGNAGAVRVLIHGADQGPLGRLGEVITRSFTVPAR